MGRSSAVVCVLALVACGNPPTTTKAKPEVIDLGPRMELFGALRGISLGTPMQEVRAKVPGFKPVEVPEPDPSMPTPPPFKGTRYLAEATYEDLELDTPAVEYVIHGVNGRLFSASFTLEQHTVEDVWKAWGTPVNAGHNNVLVDRARRMHGMVAPNDVGRGVTITIEEMAPLATWIDPDPTRFGGVQVIGRPVIDVMREFANVAREQSGPAGVVLPPTEYRDSETRLQFSVADGQVSGWQLGGVLGGPTDAVFDEVMALYAKAWGPDGEVGDYKVTFRKDSFVIDVDRFSAGVDVRMNRR